MTGMPDHASTRLILFAKRPRLGRVKTRLVPPLNPTQALTFYRALLRDTFAWMDRLPAQFTLEISIDGPWDPNAMPDGAPPRADRTEQGDGDLGARIARRFAAAFDSQPPTQRCIAVGADTPTLPPEQVIAAASALDSHDAVISPALDGGYVLLGMRALQPALLRDIPWGGSAVAERTRRAATAAGLRFAELEGWYDVDDLEGLKRLARTYRRRPEGHGAAALADLRVDVPELAVL